MAYAESHEALALRWSDFCRDPLLEDVPGKVELNRCGLLEVTLVSNRRALKRGDLAATLRQRLPGGDVLAGCSIATTDGVRVPDVAWEEHQR